LARDRIVETVVSMLRQQRTRQLTERGRIHLSGGRE
jgi:hypothetical protein